MRLWNSKLLIAVGILLLGIPLAAEENKENVGSPPVAPTQPTAGTVTQLLTVQYRPVQEVAPLLEAAGQGRVRIAVDKPGNRLVLVGQPEELNTITKLLANIDRPVSGSTAPPLELTFFFIKSAIAPIPRPPFTPLALRTLPELETTIIKDLTPLRGETLQDALDFLRSVNKGKPLNVYVDRGVDTSQAIDFLSLSRLQDVSLRVALEMLLKSVPGDLNYAINMDGIIEIATTSKLKEIGLQPQLGRQFVEGVYDIGGLGFPGSGDPAEWWPNNLPLLVGGPEAWAPTLEGNEPSVRVLNRSVMLVSQTPEIHSKIAALLNTIREPRKEQVTPLPDFLVPAADALAQNGFTNPQMLASLTVRTEGEERFETQGTTTDRANILTFDINGMAKTQSEDARARLDIIASVKTPASAVSEKGEKDSSRTLFGVQTSVLAKYGDYIVLAASPSDPDIGKAIALVIRVNVAKPLTSQPAP